MDKQLSSVLQVFIGYDTREAEAYRVAEKSLAENSTTPVCVTKLSNTELYDRRLLWRPVEEIKEGGPVLQDHLSDAPQSTEFATSRFLVPFIQRNGWALFTDCDVVFLGDVANLFALADPRFAVMCVQHGPLLTEGVKMDNQPQMSYPRKNWSSVVLWNCDHPAHHRVSLADINMMPGELLHRFYWLRDSEIGALPPEWNWLVGVQPHPRMSGREPQLAHFTLGGPWLPGWRRAPHDELWYKAANK